MHSKENTFSRDLKHVLEEGSEENESERIELFQKLMSSQGFGNYLLRYVNSISKSFKKDIRKTTKVVFQCAESHTFWAGIVKNAVGEGRICDATAIQLMKETRRCIVTCLRERTRNPLPFLVAFIESKLLFLEVRSESKRELVFQFFKFIIETINLGTNRSKVNALLMVIVEELWPISRFGKIFELLSHAKFDDHDSLQFNLEKKFGDLWSWKISFDDLISISRTCISFAVTYEDIYYFELLKFLLKLKVDDSLTVRVLGDLDSRIALNGEFCVLFLDTMNDCYREEDSEDVQGLDFFGHVWNFYTVCKLAGGESNGGEDECKLVRRMLRVLSKYNTQLNRIYAQENYQTPRLNEPYVNKVMRKLFEYECLRGILFNLCFDDWLVRNEYCRPVYEICGDSARVIACAEFLVKEVFCSTSQKSRVATVKKLLECLLIVEDVGKGKGGMKDAYLDLLEHTSRGYFKLLAKNIDLAHYFGLIVRTQELSVSSVAIDVFFEPVYCESKEFRAFVIQKQLEESIRCMNSDQQKAMLYFYCKLLQLNSATPKINEQLARFLKLFFFKMGNSSLRFFYRMLLAIDIPPESLFGVRCRKLVEHRILVLFTNEQLQDIDHYYYDEEDGGEKDVFTFLLLLYEKYCPASESRSGLLVRLAQNFFKVDYLNKFVFNDDDWSDSRILFNGKLSCVLSGIFLPRNEKVAHELFAIHSFLYYTHRDVFVDVNSSLFFSKKNSFIALVHSQLNGIAEIFVTGTGKVGNNNNRKRITLYSVKACIRLFRNRTIGTDGRSDITLNEDWDFLKRAFVLLMSISKFQTKRVSEKRKWISENCGVLCSEELYSVSKCEEEFGGGDRSTLFNSILSGVFFDLTEFIYRVVSVDTNNHKFFAGKIAEFLQHKITLIEVLSNIILRNYLCTDKLVVELLKIMNYFCPRDAKSKLICCNILYQALCKVPFRHQSFGCVAKFILRRSKFTQAMRYIFVFLESSPPREDDSDSGENSKDVDMTDRIVVSSFEVFERMLLVISEWFMGRVFRCDSDTMSLKGRKYFKKVTECVHKMFMLFVDKSDSDAFRSVFLLIRKLFKCCENCWIEDMKENSQLIKLTLEFMKSIEEQIHRIGNKTRSYLLAKMCDGLRSAINSKQHNVGRPNKLVTELVDTASKRKRELLPIEENMEIISSIRKRRKKLRNRNPYVDNMMAYRDHHEENEVDAEDDFDDLADWIVDEEEKDGEDEEIDFNSLLPERLRSNPQLLMEILGHDDEEEQMPSVDLSKIDTVK